MTRYDVIVIGIGGMGSATAYQLARRGQRVLGLDALRLVTRNSDNAKGPEGTQP